jgi:hypothetical protein
VTSAHPSATEFEPPVDTPYLGKLFGIRSGRVEITVGMEGSPPRVMLIVESGAGVLAWALDPEQSIEVGDALKSAGARALQRR